jgi:hypothetical protein
MITDRCECCGRLTKNLRDSRLIEVELGDSSDTVELWCVYCYGVAFSEAKPEDDHPETKALAESIRGMT